jgi:hypothetical protein
MNEKRKKGNLGRSRGRRGRERKFGGVTSGISSSNLFEKPEAEATSECSGCSNASSAPDGEGGGASSLSYEGRKHRSASVHKKFVDTYTGVSESEDISRWPGGGKKTLRSIGIETDCEMVSVVLHVFVIGRTFYSNLPRDITLIT